jgi:hypothetical protein
MICAEMSATLVIPWWEVRPHPEEPIFKRPERAVNSGQDMD